MTALVHRFDVAIVGFCLTTVACFVSDRFRAPKVQADVR